MRILHVITSLKIGGAESLVVNMVPHLISLGHEIGVVVFNGEYTTLMQRLENACPQCKIYRLGQSFYNPLYIIKLIDIMRDYDIVHTHNSSPQLYTAIANMICHKKLVTTEHNTSNRKRGNMLLSFVDKWMYTKYDKVICISDQATYNIRQYLGDKTKREIICTIFNGIDVNSIFEARPIENMRSTKFVIVMVAAFRPQKDQDTMIDAMLLLPEKYELWLVGDGVRRALMEKKVGDLGLSQKVKFFGLRTDVSMILKTADVVALSTHYEGLSLSNIEGMAAGKPFVASDVEGVREVTGGYGILVPHRNAKVLADTIKKLHDDSAFYHLIADKCYERAKQFDISEMVKRYNDIYLSLS